MLTGRGLGVGVDVEGVGHLWPWPLPLPQPQPHRMPRPGGGAGPRAGLRHANLQGDNHKTQILTCAQDRKRLRTFTNMFANVT